MPRLLRRDRWRHRWSTERRGLHVQPSMVAPPRSWDCWNRLARDRRIEGALIEAHGPEIRPAAGRAAVAWYVRPPRPLPRRLHDGAACPARLRRDAAPAGTVLRAAMRMPPTSVRASQRTSSPPSRAIRPSGSSRGCRASPSTRPCRRRRSARRSMRATSSRAASAGLASRSGSRRSLSTPEPAITSGRTPMTRRGKTCSPCRRTWPIVCTTPWRAAVASGAFGAVAPLAGARIETGGTSHRPPPAAGRPLAGARIETSPRAGNAVRSRRVGLVAPLPGGLNPLAARLLSSTVADAQRLGRAL
jgi:hypothetical protein